MSKRVLAELSESQLQALHQELIEFPQRFKQEIAKVIVGQQSTLDLMVVSLFCGGHVLLTGVPGLAKTLLIRALSAIFHLSFNRLQCTPDLMPSDITGVEILDEMGGGHERAFRFVQGPVFANLLLTDEINRASPRTQAALLQAMQEKQVTISGKTYDLEAPFIVFATQNPIDSEGTYPLPEAQLDRFFFNIEIDYPSQAEEIQIAAQATGFNIDALQPVFEKDKLAAFQELVEQVPVAPSLVEWIIRLVRSTRPQESPIEEVRRYVEWGAGVRASQYLVKAARAHALAAGQETVTRKNVLAVLYPVLRHRIILNFIAETEGWDANRIIGQLINYYNVQDGSHGTH